jgi:hypothetical protein
MTISARNRLASAVDNATVTAPEMAKAPVLKHRGPLFFTHGVEPWRNCVRLATRSFAQASPAWKGFA